MSDMISLSKQAVESGFWPIFTYNPTTSQLSLKSDFNEEKYDEFLSSQRRFTLTKEKGKSNLLERQKDQAHEDITYLKNFNEE